MEPRLSLITLGVADLEPSFSFYRDGLGLPTTGDPATGIVFFQTSGVALAIFPYRDLADDVGPGWDEPRSRFPGITLAHNVRHRDEVDAVLALAQAAGGEVVKPAADTSWGGYAGYFADPDGYLWEVAWGRLSFATTDPCSSREGRCTDGRNLASTSIGTDRPPGRRGRQPRGPAQLEVVLNVVGETGLEPATPSPPDCGFVQEPLLRPS